MSIAYIQNSLDFESELPSPFAKALNTVAASLTTADVSSLKLLLISDNIFKKNVLDKCSNGADILIQLVHSGYLSRKSLTFLSDMLIEIHRKDLAKDLQKIQHMEDNNFLTENKAPCVKPNLKQPMEQEEWSSLNCKTKTSETSLELWEDEYEMKSSQESISDEEKLQKYCLQNQNSEELLKMDM